MLIGVKKKTMIFVIFDIDGTLVHSNKVDSQCFSDAYEAVFDRSFPSIDWREYPHVTDDTIFATVFNKHFSRFPTPLEKDNFQKHFVASIIEKRGRRPEAFKEVPGAKAMIENLQQDNRYRVGIATGGWQAPAKVKLDFVGIDYSEIPAGYADGNPTRPDIINMAIRQYRSLYGEPTKIVYVGDAIWDLTTCEEMELPLIGIRVKGDLEFFKERGLEFVFPGYEDLTGFKQAIEAIVYS